LLGTRDEDKRDEVGDLMMPLLKPGEYGIFTTESIPTREKREAEPEPKPEKKKRGLWARLKRLLNVRRWWRALKRHFTRKQREIARLQKEMTELKKEDGDAKLQGLTKDLESAKEGADSVKKELEDYKKAHPSIEKQIEELKDTLGAEQALAVLTRAKRNGHQDQS